MAKQEKKNKLWVKVLKYSGISLLIVLSCCILVVGSYALYVVCDYNRIEDNLVLKVEHSDSSKDLMQTNTESKGV